MLTGVVLARNEEANLDRCLKSLSFCDEILVIDDSSTDSTPTLAKKLGARVVNHDINSDFSQSRNFALSQVKPGWVLFIDADETVSSQLSQEILSSLDTNSSFLIHRIDLLWGQQLKHGSAGTVNLVRLGKHDSGSWQGIVHENWETKNPGQLKNPILHYPHPTLYLFLKKINYYSTLKAQQFHSSGRKTNIFEITLGPLWRFFENYILKLGFLDGTVGFIHAMIMAFYMFLVAGKSWALSHPSS